MANVNVDIEQISPIGGTGLQGFKQGYIEGATKAAQNDTLTVTGATEVKLALMEIDATGVSEPNTKATNVITLTSATTGTVSGFVLYK